MFRQKNFSGQPNFKILTSRMPLQALNICERTSSLCQNPLKNVMMMNKIIYSVSIMRVGQFCNHYCFKTRLFFCGWMNSSMTPPTMERNSAFTDSRLLPQKRHFAFIQGYKWVKATVTKSYEYQGQKQRVILGFRWPLPSRDWSQRTLPITIC